LKQIWKMESDYQCKVDQEPLEKLTLATLISICFSVAEAPRVVIEPGQTPTRMHSFIRLPLPGIQFEANAF